MSASLRTRPAATPAMLAIFDDAATIRHALAFEAALACAQADEGIVDPAQAAAIAAACAQLVIDPDTLADEAAQAGTFAIPLVARLRAALDGPAAAAVHHGATSQDVSDSVLMLQLRAGTDLLLADVARTVAALRTHALRHLDTPAIGRTLLQDALPVGLGLRVAQWAAGIDAAGGRLAREVGNGAMLQFGGAAGTRSGQDGRGAAVAGRLAKELGLPSGPPWHARRDGPAGIGAAVGILIGALAKMACDVALLAQNAVGEMHEPRVAGRGGSSAMAHKRNPTGCQVALSAGTRAPGLVAGLLAGMPQEQERGIGGWQAEAPVLADLFLLAAGAASAMADVAQGLEIDLVAIARNIGTAALGDDIGESAGLVGELLDARQGDG